MSISVEFYGPYRDAVGAKRVSLPVESEATLATVLAAVADRWPAVSDRLRDGDDGLATGLIVLRNGSPVPRTDLSATTVRPGDTLSVAPAITGG